MCSVNSQFRSVLSEEDLGRSKARQIHFQEEPNRWDCHRNPEGKWFRNHQAVREAREVFKFERILSLFKDKTGPTP